MARFESALKHMEDWRSIRLDVSYGPVMEPLHVIAVADATDASMMLVGADESTTHYLVPTQFVPLLRALNGAYVVSAERTPADVIGYLISVYTLIYGREPRVRGALATVSQSTLWRDFENVEDELFQAELNRAAQVEELVSKDRSDGKFLMAAGAAAAVADLVVPL